MISGIAQDSTSFSFKDKYYGQNCLAENKSRKYYALSGYSKATYKKVLSLIVILL
jgi:hypothetical protein